MKKAIFPIIMLAVISGIALLNPGCKKAPLTKAPYKALVVTGQNNHNWKASSVILKQILENSELFAVDIAISPEAGKDMSTFKPVFSNYSLIVLDYNGDPWPADIRKSFEDYVSGGGGVVVYHAADNAFREWQEFNRIIGIGGWGNRDETNGPYLRWVEDKIVRDNTPGRGGSHGAQHAFRVTTREPEHPIMKGLPAAWLHAQDELYSELRGPAENLTVLATAYADTSKGGSGKHEPILMTIIYGKGRVFHTVLGHAGGDSAQPAMECVGFIATLQRGAEWAVTGDVKQTVPDDFPQFNTESKWPLFRPVLFEEILANLAGYHPGDTRTNLQDLTNYIRKNYDGGEKYAGIEKHLLRFLQGSGSSDAKNHICRELSIYGTENAVPVLKKLEKKEETKEMARYAIERITASYSN